MTFQQFSEWIERHGGTTKVAIMLGLSTSQVSLYKAGRRNTGAKMIARINEYDKEHNKELNNVTEKVAPKPNAEILHDQDIAWLPLYERRANAGIGIELDVTGEFRMAILKSSVSDPDETFAIHVRGYSGRTCITLSLEKGIRPEVLMRITGHKDIKTLMRYVHIASSVTKDEMKKAWG